MQIELPAKLFSRLSESPGGLGVSEGGTLACEWDPSESPVSIRKGFQDPEAGEAGRSTLVPEFKRRMPSPRVHSARWAAGRMVEHSEWFPSLGAKRNKPLGLSPAHKRRMTASRTQSAHSDCHSGQPRLQIASSRSPRLKASQPKNIRFCKMLNCQPTI